MSSCIAHRHSLRLIDGIDGIIVAVKRNRISVSAVCMRRPFRIQSKVSRDCRSKAICRGRCGIRVPAMKGVSISYRLGRRGYAVPSRHGGRRMYGIRPVVHIERHGIVCRAGRNIATAATRTAATGPLAPMRIQRQIRSNAFFEVKLAAAGLLRIPATEGITASAWIRRFTYCFACLYRLSVVLRIAAIVEVKGNSICCIDRA